MCEDQQQLEQAITALEEQRALLGDAVVGPAIAALRRQLADLVSSSSASRPDAINERPAERKPVTVLFADLVGFTALSERLDPETIRRLMNACFDVLKAAVDRYGGHIDKYIGDEIMALFGAPVAYEDHAERALRAALAMREAVEAFDPLVVIGGEENQVRDLEIEIAIHIGINTGMVIAGGIGARDNRQYSVMGDAVNVAARLTELSESGQILVGEITYQLTAPLFDFTALPPLVLRGRQEPQSVYALQRLQAHPGRLRGLESFGLQAPLVGRAEEVTRVQRVLARLHARQGGVLAITGEAGVGKSRFVAELRKGVELAWYEGRCLSYGEMLSYHLFLSLLRDLIGAAPEADVVALEAYLRTFLETHLLDQFTETYPYLADFLGIALSAEETERLDVLAGESLQWQTFQAFQALLLQLAQHSPLVIVMEDLHWIDPTSAVLLEQLLPLTRRAPVLFLLIQRPFGNEACQALLAKARDASDLSYEALVLPPLSAEQSRKLIWHLLAIEALPETVRELILSRAEGNPLYLEEILRGLISQNLLLREEEHWRVAPGVEVEQLDIPTTLQGVILARLDRLNRETKMVLQMAAVIGRIFWYRVLDYIVSIEQRLDKMLDAHLTRLERVELIRETRQHPDLEYIFKHVLIQDAAYQSLLKEQRRRFHRHVAEALEVVFEENLEEQYGLLAHHYEAANKVEKAVHYLQLAGDRARRAYALTEAENYYQRAFDLLPSDDDDRRRQLLFQLGLVNITQGDFTQASEHYVAAFQLRRQCLEGRSDSYAQRLLRVTIAPPLELEPAVPIDLGSANVIQQLFAGLVEFDEDLNVIPHMAERWDVGAEGCVFRFYLRRDARWSDGEPLTAHDYVYAWRRCLHPESRAYGARLLYVLRGAEPYGRGQTEDPTTIGVRAVDDYVLEVELAAPLAYFLPLLTNISFYPLPRHAWPPDPPPEEAPTTFVSNGPFRLVTWELGRRVIIERNPYYCAAFTGNVNRVELIAPQPQQIEQQVALYQAGEWDLCGVGQPRNIPALQKVVPPECWLHKSGSSVYYVGLMPHIPPLDDPRVRRALALAIDRQALAEAAPKLWAKITRGGFVPSSIPGHSPELALPYDLEQARALLREAGYRDASALPPLHYVKIDVSHPVRDAVVEQWRRGLGIRIVEETGTFDDLLVRFVDDPPHFFFMLWIADYVDPHNFLAQGFEQRGYWRDTAYWTKAEQSARILDVRKRMLIYHELDRRLVAEEALCIPLYYGQINIIVQPHVEHYPLLPVASMVLKDVVVAE